MNKSDTLLSRLKRKYENKKWYVKTLLMFGTFTALVSLLSGSVKVFDLLNRVNDKLSIVDIIVDSSPDNYEPSGYIDIKLRNTDSKVNYIKEVIFQVREVYPLHIHGRKCPSGDELEPTASYNISLNPYQAPYEFRKKVSQVVKANDVDRFLINISDYPEIADNEHLLLKFNLVLVLNADDEKIISKDILYLYISDFYRGCSGEILDDSMLSKEVLNQYKNFEMDWGGYGSTDLYKGETGDIRQIIVDLYSENYKTIKTIKNSKAYKDIQIDNWINHLKFDINPSSVEITD